MEDRLQVSLATSRMECLNVPIRQTKSCQDLLIITGRGPGIVTKFFGIHKTLWAPTLVCASDQCLLGIVANEDSQDRMAAVPETIPTQHGESGFATRCDRSQDGPHTEVENVAQSSASSGLVAHIFEARCWYVGNKHLCMTAWFAMDILWDISDGKINRISNFATEECKLCLVRGDDDRDHCGPGLSPFKGCLS